MGELGIVFTGVLPIYGAILLGLLLRRGRVLTREVDASMLRVVFNVLIPCLIWDSIIGNPALDDPRNTWLPPLVGFTSVAGGVLIAWSLAGLAGLKESLAKRGFALASGLYNWAYLAFPICVIMFGKETVGVLFVFNLGVEVCLWTVGLMVLTGRGVKDSWKKLCNGPVIGIVSALIFNALGADGWLPEFVFKAISLLGASAVPIGLLLVGATFWDHLREAAVFKYVRLGLSASFLRLGLLPALFMGLAVSFPFSPELKAVIVVQAAMPSAVFPVILAKHYGGDVMTTLRSVLWTVTLGMITMPLWIHFGLRWFGIEVTQ
ncbi:MAG: AEC family transporter [Gammaproteobacteria bacterium]|nr:AEC family transporter [Gammaproteobacteria bacterium]